MAQFYRCDRCNKEMGSELLRGSAGAIIDNIGCRVVFTSDELCADCCEKLAVAALRELLKPVKSEKSTVMKKQPRRKE